MEMYGDMYMYEQLPHVHSVTNKFIATEFQAFCVVSEYMTLRQCDTSKTKISAIKITRTQNVRQTGRFIHSFIHSFIHIGHFYSASSSSLLLRGAPDYSTDTVSEFHAEAHSQL